MEFPRKKPFRVWASIAYRIYRLGETLAPRATLKFVLNAHHFFDHLSWLAITHSFGEQAYDFPNLKRMFKWIPEGARIVDVGCGAGRVAIEASKYGSVVGIDLDDAFLETDRVEFRVADALDLKGHFDVAILSHFLEHLDEPETFLRNVPADILIIEVPNFDADARNKFRLKLGLPFYTDADHVREYTFEALESQLQRTGWSVTDSIVTGAITVTAHRRDQKKRVDSVIGADDKVIE